MDRLESFLERRIYDRKVGRIGRKDRGIDIVVWPIKVELSTVKPFHTTLRRERIRKLLLEEERVLLKELDEMGICFLHYDGIIQQPQLQM